MKIIGKRVLKTCISVLICLLIYILLMILDRAFKVDRSLVEIAPTNWYTPFFAAIAAVYAMQNNPNGSLKQASTRSFGSIIGGLFGAVLICIYELIYSKISGVENCWELSNDILFKSIQFIVTVIGLAFLIPLTVIFKKREAVFISCLTYLSVTISIRNGGMNVLLFSFNRILSTIIGVGISLYINTIPHYVKKNKNILFLSTIENSLYDGKDLSDYTKYMMNHFSYQGAKFSLMTTKTFTDLNDRFKNVRIDVPMIIFNGSCLYHDTDNKYELLFGISKEDREVIENNLNTIGADYFTFSVNKEILNCYYNKLENIGSIDFYNKTIKYSKYAIDEATPGKNVSIISYSIFEKEDIIDKIIDILTKTSCQFVKYLENKELGIYRLIIEPKGINKLNAAKIIQKRVNTNYSIAILNGKTDLCFIDNADFTMCLNTATNEIKEKVDYILDSSNSDDLLRFVSKIYYKKNYKEYLNKLKNMK